MTHAAVVNTELIPQHVVENTINGFIEAYNAWEHWLQRHPEESRRVEAMAAEIKARRAKNKKPAPV